MVYQFDPEMNPGKNFMKEWGCFVCSILRLAEDIRGKKFGATEAYSVYLAAMQTGIVQKEEWKDGKEKDGCTVYDPDALLKLAGGQGKFRKVDGASYQCAANEKQILLFHNPGTGVYHFVVGDGKGNVVWDPYERSKTVREGKIVSQWVLTV